MKRVPIEDLKVWEKNPRLIKDNRFKALCKSLQEDPEFMELRPILATKDGRIYGGNMRFRAAQHLGWKEVPAILSDIDEKLARTRAIKDNNQFGEWDDTLATMIDELEKEGVDISTLGLDANVEKMIEQLSEKEIVEDEAPPVPKEAKSKLGDLYILGNHRLLCGDSTSIDAVEKLMNGEKADITFTSPPYNLGNNAKLRGYNGDGKDTVYNEKSDHKSQEEYLSFMSAWTLIALKFSTTVFCNVQLLAGNKLALPKYWMAFHDKLIDLMIWDKEHGAPQMAARVLNSVFELIFIFTDEHEPKRSIKTGPVFRGTLQNIFRLNPVRGGKNEYQKSHGAVFPVAFAEHFITNFSKYSVLELFGGSGSTLIACEKTNRKCYMMELDPKYCDVIVQRWETLTGKKAVLQ